MCDQCVMRSLDLPAASLRMANWLPAGRVLLWVTSCLIYITLWSIRRVVFGPKSNFLPAFREGRSLQPRAVAVDVVGRAGEPRAMAADDRDQGLVEAAVVGVRSGETVARCSDAIAQSCEI